MSPEQFSIDLATEVMVTTTIIAHQQINGKYDNEPQDYQYGIEFVVGVLTGIVVKKDKAYNAQPEEDRISSEDFSTDVATEVLYAAGTMITERTAGKFDHKPQVFLDGMDLVLDLITGIVQEKNEEFEYQSLLKTEQTLSFAIAEILLEKL